MFKLAVLVMITLKVKILDQDNIALSVCIILLMESALLIHVNPIVLPIKGSYLMLIIAILAKVAVF